jgi:radical SAM superfamily enzyme YgiQ (UPF0313 family)
VAAARPVREAHPDLPVCFYGLYARLNAAHLLADGLADYVISVEAEAPLARLAAALAAGEPGEGLEGVLTRRDLEAQEVGEGAAIRAPMAVARPAAFAAPARAGLPPLQSYTHLQVDGGERLVGAVESSRGCKHTCLHCPITPVYQGRFFAIPEAVVLADVAALAAAGAGHITFADPDFLNGPRHALGVARGLHARFPALSFDFTAKVEHLLAHRDLLPELMDCGALFVVSAVESLSDTVLANLQKGHTRADVHAALAATRAAGLTLRPSLLPFTPWSTLADYQELLAFIEDEDLVDCVDPVQLTIRLLVPPGSPLEHAPAMRPHLRGLAAADFSWRWEHPDPRMDALHAAVTRLVAKATDAGLDPAVIYQQIAAAAQAAAADAAAVLHHFTHLPPPDRRRPPRLTEPWFC